MSKKEKILSSLSPVLINKKSSIGVGLSKRFFLYRLMKKTVDVIEEDPYLNFIALLKNYKILGKFLDGTIGEFHKDRKKMYFKNFFNDRELYKVVKEDLEELYPKYKDIRVTITKRGVIIYNNYKKNAFNVLLMTIHSGIWVPESIKNKLSISEKDRYREEDVDSHKLYYRLVLEKGGIWIDNKQSRFVVDFNRNFEKAIYADRSEEWLNVVWKHLPTEKEKKDIYDSYKEFYFTLLKLVETHYFNIIFDGHSMKNKDNRPNISFGTRYIPTFYMPIVKGMQRKMISMGYSPVALNSPYFGGYILRWLGQKFPNIFIFSMEVNKKLYMNDNHTKSYKRKLANISKDIMEIVNIEEDIEEKHRKNDKASK
ncbi:N-formylglutamate amidohydrolase [Nanoarchaeota archaeon]